jgi:kumamolisin
LVPSESWRDYDLDRSIDGTPVGNASPLNGNAGDLSSVHGGVLQPERLEMTVPMFDRKRMPRLEGRVVGGFVRRRNMKFYCAFLTVAFMALAARPLAAQQDSGSLVTLPGHVIGTLSNATKLPRTPAAGAEQITFSVVLKLSDPAALDAFEQEFNDPNSAQYHLTLRQNEFTIRFGPSPQAYDQVMGYLQQKGFTLLHGSNNRRTITVTGTRAQMEDAFHVLIDDYQFGDRTFHAIADEPGVPNAIASFIAGITGLSNFAQPQPALTPTPPITGSTATAYNGALTPAGFTNTHGLPPGLNGAGQTIALIEYDNFNSSDLLNWILDAGLPLSAYSQVSTRDINGGTSPSYGRGTKEVMLDIAGSLGIAQGANIIVFDTAYQSTDFLTAVNDTITSLSDLPGGTIVHTWLVCESEISSSDATAMDALIKDASFYGFTVFTASGDSGSVCTAGDGTTYPGETTYPADSPHSVAVGGTFLSVNSDNTYNSESWWTGGGFGISKYLPQSAHQSKFFSASGRSVPDVAMQAKPNVDICMATTDSSPGCSGDGGTSLSAPLWAGVWALVQQAAVDAGEFNFSAANGYLYTIPGAFHRASSMTGAGNDFAHVGLGSPNITKVVAKSVPPQIDDISVATGPAAGGTKVDITGVGFIGVQRVTFGGVKGTHLTIHSDRKLTIETPAAPEEIANVKLVTPGGTSTAASPFVYEPEITGVSPGRGPMQGGTTITVTGRALSDTLSFIFGGIAAATKVKCSSSTKCTMVTPAHIPATVDIVAEPAWGYGFSPTGSADQFTYESPSITGFSPRDGPTTGGLVIGINGTSLEDGKTVVSFGGVPGTDVSCSDDTFCIVTNPAHAAGAVHLSVTVDGITSAETSGEFTFAVFPTITGISPGIGKGGDTVTLTGTGFKTALNKTVFSFSGQDATGVNCSSTTTCTATVPPEITQSDYVLVTVNGHTSLNGVVFTYSTPVPPPPCKGTSCN